MTFWITLAAYELAWLAAVAGAGQGRSWPGVLAVAAFAAWRLATSARRRVELQLAAVALVMGLVLEAAWTGFGLVRYAAPWPSPTAPAWLMALWVAFALTVMPLFGYLHERRVLAACVGAVGGPLAYLAAARGWHALTMAPPTWPALVAIAAGWAAALPLLTSLAGRWSRVPGAEATA